MFQRDLKLFLHSLRTLVLLIVILLAGCVGTILTISGLDSPSLPKPKVVLCNLDRDSNYGSTLLTIASGHEMVDSLLDISFCDTEAEAEQAVLDGAIASIILPEHFFSSTAHGESIPCRLILNGAGEGAQEAIRSYADIGSEILTSGQLVIFTGDYYAIDHQFTDEAAAELNVFLNVFAFAEFESARNRYFSWTQVPFTTGNLSQSMHYVALYLSFFVGLLILGYYHLYQTDLIRSRLLWLRSSGVRERAFLRWKWLLPLLFSMLLMIPFCLAATRFVPMFFSPVSLLSALFGLAFAAVFGSLLSIAFSGVSGAILFTVHIIGLFFCGGIIPYSRLEPFILTLGDLTPLGVIYRAFGPLFGGSFSIRALLTGIVYCALAFALAHRHMISVTTGKEAS